ncbi:MAG: hypothetical protein CMJ50_00310 [Planctomycetaceae bacterium]|nr:hypothetical protein [Planctomycetaceae bacterium]
MSEQPRQPDGLPQPALPRRVASRRWPAVLAALILLVSGGVIGGVAGSLKVRSDVMHAMHNPDEMIRRFNQHMSDVLGLSQEQSALIAEILEPRHAAIAEHRQQIHENMRMIEQEVGEVLTAEQAQKWKRRKEAFERRRGFGFRHFGRDGRRGRDGPMPGSGHHRPSDPNRSRPDPRILFESSDLDGDGKLTLNEFASDAPEPERAMRERRFRRLDADADGQVTPQEFESFNQRHQHRRPGPPPDAGPSMPMPEW